MLSPPITEAEIRDKTAWHLIDVLDALGKPKGEVYRCPECHGEVVPNRPYSDGAKAHFAHRVMHSGCSTRPGSFSGVKTKHPNALG